MEEPCDKTGRGCQWVCEDQADGAWDLYCADCFRWRDWSKDDYKGI